MQEAGRKYVADVYWRRGKRIDTAEFTGYVGILNIYAVSEPQIWRYNGEELVVCNDMIAEQGYDEDEIPYFYDLYLDLVVYPDGTIIEDDMDELQSALEKGDITQELFEQALATSNKLRRGLLSDINALKAYVQKLYDIVKQ